MHTTIRKNRLSSFTTRTAAVTLFAASSILVSHAQQSAGTTSSLSPVPLTRSLAVPLDLAIPNDLSYSSSVGEVEMAAAENFNLTGSEDTQPPPRRPYGRRPTYSDSTHNADGSNKWAFIVGGGFNLPVGGTHGYATTSYRFQGGVVRNFNKNFGVILQFDWDNLGINTKTLNNLLAIYNGLNANLSQIGGDTHIWSFTFNPIYNFAQRDNWGGYVVGGLGYYHKSTTFTTPGVAQYCDPFYGCYLYQANQAIDKYTSNAFGVNGGFGLTYKFSRFADERFFAEARYVYNFNSRRPFDVSGTTAYFNAFPQNSQPTSFIPVTFGIRF
jgi:hypothetical protein